MHKFNRKIIQYAECFDCGKVEYVLRHTDAKMKFKLVPIEIEMPARLNNIRGGQFIALCPRCFDMMNTDDF